MHWGDQPIEIRIVGRRIIDPGHFDGTSDILKMEKLLRSVDMMDILFPIERQVFNILKRE